jgi:hypothetical protein
MGLFLYSQAGPWQSWLEWSSGAQILQMAWLVIGGAALYFAVLFAAGMRWRDVYR